MATVAVMREAPGGSGDADVDTHPKMTIVTEDGDAFTVPYAPRETVLDGVAPVFSTADRGGRSPLLLRAGNGLPQITFDLVFGFANPQRSVEHQLSELRKLAKSGKRMRVNLDPTTTANLWRLTGFTQTTVARQYGTNKPTRALCSLTFQKASDAVVAVGPVSGGAKKKGDDDKKRPRFHTWQKGDTLVKVAVRYYGEAAVWRKIADANNIRDPKNIRVGRRLVLPLVRQ
jgi:hypothetical protein